MQVIRRMKYKMGIEGLVVELISGVLKEGQIIHGIVHKRMPAAINGEKGFLVWDWVVWNEITFDYLDNTKWYSLFKSMSDK